MKELKADLFLNRTMESRLPKLPIASAEFEHDLQLGTFQVFNTSLQKLNSTRGM